MNKLIVIMPVLLFLLSCQKYTYKREQRLREQGKIHCGWYGKKTIAECRKMYPFNKAAKILLISFPDYEIDEYSLHRVFDTIIAPNGEKLLMPRTVLGSNMVVKITQPVLDTIKIFRRIYSVYEKLELLESQIDTLSNLCENYTTNYRLIYGTKSITCCYKPRNAIVFLISKISL